VFWLNNSYTNNNCYQQSKRLGAEKIYFKLLWHLNVCTHHKIPERLLTVFKYKKAWQSIPHVFTYLLNNSVTSDLSKHWANQIKEIHLIDQGFSYRRSARLERFEHTFVNSLEYRCQFYQRFKQSFCAPRSQKCKKTLMTWLSYCTYCFWDLHT